jgi:putative RecB family exonuclease
MSYCKIAAEVPMRPLSYSQISAYESCPLSYKLQYIDRLEPKAKWYFSFGDTLHKCAEYFFKAKLPSYPTLEELLSFYDDNWKSEGWESIEDETSHMAYGAQILSDFWDINSRDFKVPLATEKMFIVDIEGVKLRGYIDRLDKLATGGLAIVDYKSDKELFTKDYVENFFQLTLYQLACERMWHMPVEKLTLYHLRSNTPVSCGPRSHKKLDEASGIVVSVAENIAAGRFPAKENQYCPCDFPEHCPYYKHKYGKPLPERRQPERLRNVAIADVVERYAALQDEQRLVEAELNELKDLIIQYCKAGELNRVFGREHAITYKTVERTGYDENKVRAVLEPAGLWDRVLKFDPAMMKALVESSDIPNDVKERLASLVEVVSSYPRLWTKSVKEDREE